MDLLAKVRKLNTVLQAYEEIDISQMASVLSELEDANIYCVNSKGMLLGYKQLPKFVDEDKFVLMGSDKYLSELYTRYLQNIIKTEIVKNEISEGKDTVIVPVFYGNLRLGTLIAELTTKTAETEDLVIIEFAATALAAAIRSADALREKQLQKVMVALETLSFTETRAVKAILGGMEDMEGYLVASKIADEANITRSVIVNAMRKLESAGVIEARSLGMKGTYIKVLLPMIMEKLK